MTTRRSTGFLAVASAVNGLLAYVFFAVATRSLGAETTAPVSVLWTYWSFAAAALTFPLQHWITHSVTAHGGEGQVRSGLPRMAGVMLVVSAAAGLVAWLLREPLFRRDDAWFPLLVGLLTFGSAYIGVVRGALSARGQFVGLGWALMGENGVRVVGVAALALAGVQDPVLYGLVLVGGQLVGLAWPTALVFSRGVDRPPTGSPLAFLGGASAAQVLGQTVLTGAPVLLALRSGAPAQVTALFAGLAVFRAPYTLALGVVPQLTGRLTLLASRGDAPALRRVRNLTAVVTLVGLLPVGLLAAWLGPPVLRLVFGDDVVLEAPAVVLVAVGSAVAVANLVLTVLAMAHGRPATVVRAWLLGVVAAALAFLALDVAELERTATAFLVAEAVAFLALLVAGGKARRR
jgi:O-antigen/teichoic acid export membrane protein